jgi:hypothetical protein
MYAPTNLNQYGTFLRNRPIHYTCGNVFYDACTNSFPYNYFPYYLYININDNYKINNSYPLNCIPGYSCFGTGNTSLTDWRILDSSYNIIQSAAGEPILDPMNSFRLTNNSPKDALNSGKIIPTFLMHGDGSSDKMVPYNKSNSGMKNKLIAVGGLIDSLNGNNASVNYNYSSRSEKHLMKMFPGADHGWANTSAATKDSIRSNIVVWLNGHK